MNSKDPSTNVTLHWITFVKSGIVSSLRQLLMYQVSISKLWTMAYKRGDKSPQLKFASRPALKSMQIWHLKQNYSKTSGIFAKTVSRFRLTDLGGNN